METLRDNGKLAKTHGYCIQDEKTGRFTIRVRVKEKGKSLHHYTVLDTLAHELAHVRYWDHTPGHMKLQSRIMLRFGQVLKKRGFISMEHQPRFFKEMCAYAAKLDRQKAKKISNRD